MRSLELFPNINHLALDFYVQGDAGLYHMISEVLSLPHLRILELSAAGVVVKMTYTVFRPTIKLRWKKYILNQ